MHSVHHTECSYSNREVSCKNTLHGDLYRLASPFKGNNADFEYISEDEKTVLLFYFNIKGTPNTCDKRIRLRGLNPVSIYRNKNDGELYSGETLMNLGLLMPINRDNISKFLVFEQLYD